MVGPLLSSDSSLGYASLNPMLEHVCESGNSWICVVGTARYVGVEVSRRAEPVVSSSDTARCCSSASIEVLSRIHFHAPHRDSLCDARPGAALRFSSCRPDIARSWSASRRSTCCSWSCVTKPLVGNGDDVLLAEDYHCACDERSQEGMHTCSGSHPDAAASGQLFATSRDSAAPGGLHTPVGLRVDQAIDF